MRLATFCAVVVCMASRSGADSPAAGGLGVVDFRYTVPWWQSAICLPDDPDKTLVGKEGQLLFDYGDNQGYRQFSVAIQPEIVERSKWIRQETVSPRVPIVRTWKDAQGVEILEETFVVTPQPGHADAKPRLERTDGEGRQRGWAKPTVKCASVFTGIEVTYGGSVLIFRLAAPPKGKATIVFGLCEGWHKEAGKRPLILTTEGGDILQIDPVKDFGANVPGLYKLVAQDTDNNRYIDIRVETPAGATDRNAIVNAIWAFEGDVPSDANIISGAADRDAYACFPGGALPERRVVMLWTLKNTTTSKATRQPALTIRSVGPVSAGDDRSGVTVGDGTRVVASPAFESAKAGEHGVFSVKWPAVALDPGAQQQIALTIDRHTRTPAPAVSVEQARALRDTARTWWESADLPFETTQVPDAGIQAMLESCVRNIWQAREIKKGKPAFHVGPTCYRGLWVVDGSFLLESAALLGRGQDARAGVEYLLSHQKPDGSFELLGTYWKENGIVLWAATRHAFLTQDKKWLRAQWPALERVVKAIQNLRERASKDPKALDYRLLPAGFIDGGIGGNAKPEYSNTVWCLAGLKSAIAAAHWLGEEGTAAAWQKEYDDFYATYRKAVTRDMLKDGHGNAYCPTMMGNGDKHVPARGQWAWCHAVYPGQIFPSDDPFVQGQLAMLRATKVQGMVFGTGWAVDGIWTYFASFYAHACLWQGQGREAAEVLYDFARHACPTRVWREEQLPVGKGDKEVGDMPHNWASAEFIRLTTHLLELDRGNELHLLEGFPREWTGARMVTRLNGVLTPFGPLHLEVRISEDGKNAQVKMSRLQGSQPAKVVLHLDGLTRKGGTMELPTDRDVNEVIPK